VSEPPDWAEGTNEDIHGFPNQPGATMPDVGRIGKMFTGLIEAVLKKVVLAIVGVVLPGPLINQLQHWADVLLPDQILQPIRDLITIIVNVLDLIPIIGPPAGDALEYFGQIFGVIKDKTDAAQATGEGAQESADHANVGVAQLEAKLAQGNVPGGVLIDDTFNRAGSDIGPDYTLSYFSGSAGTVKIADGNAYWDALGGDARGCIVLHNTPLHTDYQAVAVVQNAKFPTITNPTHLRLILRADATLTNYVEARFSREGCSIGKVVAGVYTSLDTAPGRNAAGDRWTFKAGTDVDDREFILYCNSDAIITVTDDSGTLSNLGPDFLHTAFVMKSGTQFVGFAFVQNPPPSIQSFTANDRLAAA
jgi:hypothetical protein